MTLHPLRNLINEYCGEEMSNAELGRRMSKNSLDAEGYIDGVNCEHSWYEEEKESRANNDKINIGKWLKYKNAGEVRTVDESVRPTKVEKLLSLQKAIGCTLEEVLEIFYFEYCSSNLVSNAGNQDLKELIIGTDLGVDSQTFVKPPTPIDEEQLGFRFLEVESIARYFPDGSMQGAKIFKIKCLQDGLQVIEDLEFYKGFGDKIVNKYSSKRYEIVPGSSKIYISVRFNQPLKKENTEYVTINYSCSKLHKSDNTFHATSVLFPTSLLKLKYTPPNLELNNTATLYEFKNRLDYLGRRQSVSEKQLTLKNSCFTEEIPNPPLNAQFMVYWGS